MVPSELPIASRVLLVDDDDAVRNMMNATLERRGFEVVTAPNVAEALRWITIKDFDVLITDLHMPNPGDGLTVVTAMRHSQPNALTLLVSGYPDVEGAVAAILLQADEIIVKPFDAGRLADLLRHKVGARKPTMRLAKERVGVILQRSVAGIVESWLARVKRSDELTRVPLSDEDRTRHLPRLVEDLVIRLRMHGASAKDSDADNSTAAVAHGKVRFQQGYTPSMLVHESRILQVTLFGTLQANLSLLDFSILLPDVMAIADEVDAQLTETMDSYMSAMRERAVA
jgi:ActR/RegA family two-component response regulator